MISCLMVALPAAKRLAGLKASLADYCRQTCADRELLILINGGDPATARAIGDIVRGLGRADVRLLELGGELPLGALRNIAWAEARGEIVCQWDDDDRYHPERLAVQHAAMAGLDAEATCLQFSLQLRQAERRIFCLNWRSTADGVLAGSLMCRRSAEVSYPEAGQFARMGEDSDLVGQLKARGGFRVIEEAPHYYVYVTHDANTWSAAHHQMLTNALSLSRGLLLRREAEIRAGLAAYDFGLGELTVHGSNGPAFAWTPTLSPSSVTEVRSL